jgi:ribonuclease BN (tRNA processing enzyme)
MYLHEAARKLQMSGNATLMLLGTQGWIPTPRRATTCLAYRDEDALFVFDAGTGLARFLEQPASGLLEGVDEVHLLMTHYHLDHSVGLSYLSGIFPHHKVTVHVPAATVNGVEPSAGVPALIRRPFFPVDWAEQKNVSLETLREGDNLVAGVPVRLRAQTHADVSAGYRIADRFTFVTDTIADPATATFAAGAELLVHEAWIDGREESESGQEKLVRRTYGSHASARQAAALAAQAEVEELYLVHLNPAFDEDYYRQMERSARAVFPATLVPDDLHARTFAGG